MSQNLIAGFSTVVFAFTLTVGCGSAGKATGSTCPPSSTLTYENFGKAFIQTNCLSCHATGGAETPTLDTLAAVRREKSKIDELAAAGPNAVNTEMPDEGTVAEAERRKLGEWLACNAPEK